MTSGHDKLGRNGKPLAGGDRVGTTVEWAPGQRQRMDQVGGSVPGIPNSKAGTTVTKDSVAVRSPVQGPLCTRSEFNLGLSSLGRDAAC